MPQLPPTENGGRKSSLAKQVLLFAMKAAIAAALIYWLVRQNRLDLALLARLRADAQTLMILLAGGAGVLAGLLFLAWRLKRLLEFRGLAVSLGRALGLTLVGSFSGAVLPGLVGGDVVKAAYLCADEPGRRADAVAAVILDRLVGLYALFLLGTIAWVAAAACGTLPAGTPVLLTAPACVVLGTVGMALLAWPALRQSRPVRWLFALAPARVQRLLRALTSYVKAPRVIVVAVLLSLANHSLVVFSYVAAGQLLDAQLRLSHHFILDPLAMAMNAVAITPGGIGLAEGAFSFLFEAAGSPSGLGATVGLLGRFIQYGVFTIGGVAALLAMRAGRR